MHFLPAATMLMSLAPERPSCEHHYWTQTRGTNLLSRQHLATASLSVALVDATAALLRWLFAGCGAPAIVSLGLPESSRCPGTDPRCEEAGWPRLFHHACHGFCWLSDVVSFCRLQLAGPQPLSCAGACPFGRVPAPAPALALEHRAIAACSVRPAARCLLSVLLDVVAQTSH